MRQTSQLATSTTSLVVSRDFATHGALLRCKERLQGPFKFVHCVADAASRVVSALCQKKSILRHQKSKEKRTKKSCSELSQGRRQSRNQRARAACQRPLHGSPSTNLGQLPSFACRYLRSVIARMGNAEAATWPRRALKLILDTTV